MNPRKTTITLTQNTKEALRHLIRFAMTNTAYCDLIKGFCLDEKKFPVKTAELCLRTDDVSDLKNLLAKLV